MFGNNGSVQCGTLVMTKLGPVPRFEYTNYRCQYNAVCLKLFWIFLDCELSKSNSHCALVISDTWNYHYVKIIESHLRIRHYDVCMTYVLQNKLLLRAFLTIWKRSRQLKSVQSPWGLQSVISGWTRFKPTVLKTKTNFRRKKATYHSIFSLSVWPEKSNVSIMWSNKWSNKLHVI